MLLFDRETSTRPTAAPLPSIDEDSGWALTRMTLIGVGVLVLCALAAWIWFIRPLANASF